MDSELLCRLAGRAARGGPIDTVRFKDRLRFCRGQMAAVLASRLDPETVLVLKGNKPLELRFHKRHRAILYASDPAYLDAVLDEERGWCELSIPPMSLLVFRHRMLTDFSIEPFQFIAQVGHRETASMEEIGDW